MTNKSPRSLVARMLPFQGGEEGSKPFGGTTFDDIALLIAFCVISCIAFVSFAIFCLGMVTVITARMHLDDPDDERLERISYATLCLFLFGSIYWLPYLLR